MQQTDNSLSFGKKAAVGQSADIIDVTLQGFRADVMEESLRRLVVVDFWAPWCQPCKQLGPILEKLVKAANGKIRLAKMDIDQYPEIAQKLGVQSIPAVVAFQGGQMVDGFVGALPESEIKAFFARCIGPAGDDAETLFAEAQALLEAGDLEAAEPGLARVLQRDPEHVGAQAGFARILAARGDLVQAKAILDAIPANKAGAAPVTAARAALALLEQAGAVGDLAFLLARVENVPTDHQARYDLAVALNAAARRDAAAQELLNLIKRDRAWNDEAARKLLLQLFETWGPLDPATRAARRQLSSLLFS
jgi:putative thioredoxin